MSSSPVSFKAILEFLLSDMREKGGVEAHHWGSLFLSSSNNCNGVLRWMLVSLLFACWCCCLGFWGQPAVMVLRSERWSSRLPLFRPLVWSLNYTPFVCLLSCLHSSEGSFSVYPWYLRCKGNLMLSFVLVSY